MPENSAPNGPATDGTEPAATPVNAPAVTPATPAAPPAPADNPPGYDALGDPGKRALDAMKAERNAEREARKELEQRIAELETAQSKSDPRADRRIVRAEIKAAAKGVLADPTDALTFLDLSGFEVSEDGEVDGKKISDALDDLLKAKPHLAAKQRPRFEGRADNGAQGRASAPDQLTREDVKRLAAAGKHDEIAKAKSEGRLNDVLGLNK